MEKTEVTILCDNGFPYEADVETIFELVKYSKMIAGKRWRERLAEDLGAGAVEQIEAVLA